MKVLNETIKGRPLPLVGEVQHPATGGVAVAPEKLATLKAAAEALGLPTWKLSRAAAQGLFPIYRVLNSRKLVKLSEVLAAIDTSQQGAANARD